MLPHAYKQYLAYLRRRTKPSLLSRSLVFTFLAIFMMLGTVSAFFYYQLKKETPKRAQLEYLQLATGGFVSSKQSIEEILTDFKIAGAKIEVVESSKDATPSSLAFFTALDDLAKISSKIEAARKNIIFQKEILGHKQIPIEYSTLNGELTSYYDEVGELFDEVLSQHQFAKSMLVASGPNFFLPVISNEPLWQVGDKNDLVVFYQKIKTDANSTLESLSKLNVPPRFKNYYKTQIAYLELVVSVSDKVVNLLSQENKEEPESATQIEKAYQLLIDAKKENEGLSQQLLIEKLSLVDLKQNLATFAPVLLKQNSLEVKLAEITASRPEKANVFEYIVNKLQNLKFWGVYK